LATLIGLLEGNDCRSLPANGRRSVIAASFRYLLPDGRPACQAGWGGLRDAPGGAPPRMKNVPWGKRREEWILRIAYLEDDTAQADLVQHWLAEAGHTCMHCTNGREFMVLMRRETFDLLLLDWEVPDMSGRQVLDELRAAGNAVPV